MNKNRFGKTVLLCILTILLGCTKTAPAGQPTPKMELTPIDSVVVSLSAPDMVMGVGEIVDVTVEVRHVVNMIGAEVHLQFDPTYIQVEDEESGTEGVQVLHGDFLQPDFVAVNAADNSVGTVDYAIAQMPPHGAVEGSGYLCTIRVKAKAPGIASFVLRSVVLADTGAQQIPATIVNNTLELTIE